MADNNSIVDHWMANAVVSPQPYNPPNTLNNSDFYPGINQGVQVGTHGSRTLGSQPIFAPTGQYAPMSALEKKADRLGARQAQLDAERNAFVTPNVPGLKNPRWQEQFNQDFYDFIEESIAEADISYGKDKYRALKDQRTDIGRKFVRGLQNFETMARDGDQIMTELAEVTSAYESGDVHLGPKAAKEYYDALGMVGDFRNTDYGSISEKLQVGRTWLTLNKIIHDRPEMVEEMQAASDSIASEWEKRKSGGGFTEWHQTVTTNLNRAINQQAENIKQEFYRDFDQITTDDIADYLKAYGGYKKEFDIKIQKDPRPPKQKEDKKKWSYGNGGAENSKWKFTYVGKGSKDPTDPVGDGLVGDPEKITEFSISENGKVPTARDFHTGDAGSEKVHMYPTGLIKRDGQWFISGKKAKEPNTSRKDDGGSGGIFGSGLSEAEAFDAFGRLEPVEVPLDANKDAANRYFDNVDLDKVLGEVSSKPASPQPSAGFTDMQEKLISHVENKGYSREEAIELSKKSKYWNQK